MKMPRILSLALFALLCAPPGAQAATPTFGSFDTNDFRIVTNVSAPWKIFSNRANTTNGFTNVVIINTNVTVLNTYVTNITENSFVTVTNSIVNVTNTTITVNGTNVATINPTDGRIPYRSGTNSFDDSALYFIDTNTVGAVEVDVETVGVTNLVTGGLVASVDTGLGYGVLTNVPFANFTLWTNAAGVLQPTAGTSVVATNLLSATTLTAGGAFLTPNFNVTFAGPGTTTVDPTNRSLLFFASIATNGVVVQLDTGNGTGQRVTLINVFTNSTFTLPSGPLADNGSLFVTVRGGAWTPTEPGESIDLVGVPGGWIEVNRAMPTGPVPALGTNYWTNALGVLQPIDLTLPVRLTNQLQFNLAGTNVLYSSNQFLVYSNASVTIPGGYATVSGDGSEARYTAGGNLAIVRGIAGVDLIDALASGNDLRWGFNAFTPLQTGTALGAFGGGSQPWNHAMIGSSNQWGLMGVTSGLPNVLINGTNYALAPISAATAINATDTYLPARLNATTFTNSPLYTVAATNIGIDSGFYFGPGTSNWFGRFGTDLWLTNGGSGTTVGGLVIMTGDGSSNKLTAAGNLANLFGVAGVGLYDSFSSGKEVRWTSNTLMPINSAGSLGQNAAVNSSPLQWSFTSQKTNFVNGFTSSITTNYSRLTTYHGGTNDFVHLVSEGAGIAGSAKPILVSVALVTSGVSTVTNIIEFDGTSGTSTTGVLIYENGTAQRVTIGTNDSAGVGFRILKVPN